MKSIPKRHVKVSLSQQFNYHIEAFNHLIKMLYPKRESINKYEFLITKNNTFNTSQQQIIAKTAHSLCMVSEFYRDQDQMGRLYITREDICNAIHLLQNELELTNRSILLPPVLRWYAFQIQYHFQGKEFTLKQVQQQLQKSRTRVYEAVRELEFRKMIRLVGLKGQAHVFELIDSVK